MAGKGMPVSATSLFVSATLSCTPSFFGMLSPSGSLLVSVQRQVSPLAPPPHLWGLSVLQPFFQAQGLARHQWPRGAARGFRLPLPSGQLSGPTPSRASVALCPSWLPLSNVGDHGNPAHLLFLLHIGERTHSHLPSLAPPHPGDLSSPRDFTS